MAGTSDSSFFLRVFPGWKGWRVGQLVLVSLSDVVADLCLQGLFDQNLSSETVGTGRWSLHESQGSIGNGLDAPIYMLADVRSICPHPSAGSSL